MARLEIQREESPYKLSIEELTCPDGDKARWFEQLVVRQREGVEHGVRPRNPRLLGYSLRKLWVSKVWNYYLNGRSFSRKERRVIEGTVRSGKEYHTHSTHCKLRKDG